MKIRCVYNTGEVLRNYETKSLKEDELSKFGFTENTQFGLTINKEYIVVGMFLSEGTLNYLIDESDHVSAYSCLLFQVVENKIPSTWFFRSLKINDINYPYLEAIWGYYELVFDDNHYEKLVYNDEGAMITYFNRKKELEKEEK